LRIITWRIRLGRGYVTPIVAALLAVEVWLLYRKVLGLWWTYDDPNILRTLFDYRFIDIFTNARVWPQQLFTPLLLVVFEGEWKLFAFEPSRWYAMQLGIAWMTAFLVYAAVRQFLDSKRAFIAAVLFTAGPPLCSVVIQLSTLHYYLAISFCALAVALYAIAVRRLSGLAAALSIACYFLAMTAKEVAIPLPLLLLALPLRDLRTRFRFLIAHAVAAIVYFAWRYAVLDALVGAYGWKIDASEWPRLLMLLPWRIAQGAAGAGLAMGFALVAIMTLTIVLGVRNRQAVILVVAAIIVVCGPMLPLAKEVNRRYVAMPWLAWSVAFAAATTRRSSRTAAALLLAAPLLAIGANRQEWRHEFPLRRRMAEEARFFFYEQPADALLRRPLTPTAALGEVQWLKTIHFDRRAGAWFYDDLYLCGGAAVGKRVFEYERSGIVEITPLVAAIATKHCGSIRAIAPLAADFHFGKPALYWSLGPYAGGKYSAVIGNGVQAFEIPRRDALQLPGMTRLALRIRYDSPVGWTTYSPELTLDFVHHPDLSWRR
jgi:NADH:ubiquinone oxidoreductase subunit K